MSTRTSNVELSSRITLVLGGARSGKSEVAEGIAARLGPVVTYVATGARPAAGGPDSPGAAHDDAWAARVAANRARRPPAWPTVELVPGGDLVAVLSSTEGPVLVDSLGVWVTGLPELVIDPPAVTGISLVAAEDLVAALCDRRRAGWPTVVVSDEVGLGVHPSTAIGNVLRDVLGTVNRQVADAADDVLLVVAGRTLVLGPAPGAARDGPG